MLPSFLDSTYKRYKSDTSIFVKWLFENAQKCGYVPETREAKSPAAAPPAAKSIRLKGKARKDAKKSGPSQPTAALTASDETEKRGLCEMVETTKKPMWLAMATSCFLGIHHVLRDSVGSAFSELQTIHSTAKQTIEKYLDLSKDMTSPANWQKSNQETIRNFAEGLAGHIQQDVNFPFKETLHRTARIAPPGGSERFYLHKRQPILCGLFAFRLVLALQYFGVGMANSWGTVIYPAHLYNALRQNINPINSWPLMEEIIAIHGEDRIFVGARPVTMTECFKQVTLMLGYSASTLAKNRRNHKTVASKNGPRSLNDTSPLGEIFRKGLTSDGSTALTVHNIEKLLNEQARDAAVASDPKSKSVRRKWQTSKRLTPLQALEALRVSMPVELPKLKFDYFFIYRQSIQLLRALKAEMDGDFLKAFGPGYLENEGQLPWLGPWLLMVACQTEKTAELLKISEAGSKILEKAGSIVEKVVKEQPQRD